MPILSPSNIPSAVHSPLILDNDECLYKLYNRDKKRSDSVCKETFVLQRIQNFRVLPFLFSPKFPKYHLCFARMETLPQILYHIGYSFPEDKTFARALLGQVRVVLLVGTPSRAKRIVQALGGEDAGKNLCRTDRYVLLIPQPGVLVASHGIGLGSVDCLLQDVHHLLLASGAKGWVLLRLGSSGGLGVPPGTLVVTRTALNGVLLGELVTHVLGRPRALPGRLDAALSLRLLDFARGFRPDLHIVLGDTLCAETFFDAQARLDGVDPLYSSEDRDAYLHSCIRAGVVNIEMESLPLASFAARVGVPAVVVCAVFVDRLQHETPTDTHEKLAEFEGDAVDVVVEFVKQLIQSPTSNHISCQAPLSAHPKFSPKSSGGQKLFEDN